MPELPEVETVRSDLATKIINKRITKVEVRKSRLVRNGPKKFKEILVGNSIIRANRRGKLMYFELKRPTGFLLVHLKMTGQLIYQKNKKITAGGHSYGSMKFDLPNKHLYIIITFVDKSQLFFNDMRTFGYMHIVNAKELQVVLDRFGIEPLTSDFTLSNFQQALQNRKTSIKALLLNQQLIAGIGNIYADEVCFRAGVKPERLVNNLNDSEIKKLWQSSDVILKKAIEARGTTFNDYVDASGKQGNYLKSLKVFHRDGQQCLKCKTNKIIKIKLAGRGTHFCEFCQK